MKKLLILFILSGASVTLAMDNQQLPKPPVVPLKKSQSRFSPAIGAAVQQRLPNPPAVPLKNPQSRFFR
jgi:hypothetical protein